MGIIRESEANAQARAKKVANVKKEEKAPIVFKKGDDSVEPIDNGDDIDTIASETVVEAEDDVEIPDAAPAEEEPTTDAASETTEETPAEETTEEAVGDAAPADNAEAAEAPETTEAPAEEAPEKKKPGRPRNSDKK